jgi:hypothetical protein
VILQIAVATIGSLALNVAFLYRQPLAAIVAGLIYAVLLWKL